MQLFIKNVWMELTISALINSEEEMNDIMKIVKSLKESGLLKQLKMKQKDKKILGMLLGTLGAGLENLLTVKA